MHRNTFRSNLKMLIYNPHLWSKWQSNKTPFPFLGKEAVLIRASSQDLIRCQFKRRACEFFTRTQARTKSLQSAFTKKNIERKNHLTGRISPVGLLEKTERHKKYLLGHFLGIFICDFSLKADHTNRLLDDEARKPSIKRKMTALQKARK